MFFISFLCRDFDWTKIATGSFSKGFYCIKILSFSVGKGIVGDREKKQKVKKKLERKNILKTLIVKQKLRNKNI